VANNIDPSVLEGAVIYEPNGCSKCNNIGYKGRGAIMEVLPISDSIRAATVKGASSSVLRDLAIQEGMVTLKDAGLLKVRNGLTSLHAALEVTGSE
jgi:type IV pilus assembly protein PilB